jgi:hypothetical protein
MISPSGTKVVTADYSTTSVSYFSATTSSLTFIQTLTFSGASYAVGVTYVVEDIVLAVVRGGAI